MMPTWRRLLKAKRRPLGGLGDLSIAAHGTPDESYSYPVVGARYSSGLGYGYSCVAYNDDMNIYGYGTDHAVLLIYRRDDPNEGAATLATSDLGTGTWLTEWQLRLEIWGDPTDLTVRGKAWRTGDSEPGWTTATDNYALIPRSDDTYAQGVTIDSVERLGW
jgi:hypothetical protein